MENISSLPDLKYAIVIPDGAAGEPLPEYDGLTTLQAAYTPNLDTLAQNGLVGMAKNVPDGLEPSSNIACTSICGYDPALYPIGRGALEGAALGIKLQPDEVAMRLNLTNVSPQGIMVSYSTNNIDNDSGHVLLGELVSALNDDTFTLHIGTGFRGILVVKGHPGLMQSNFVAAHNITDEAVADYPSSGPEAQLIIDYQKRAKAVLAASPLNAQRIKEGKLPATDVFVFWPGQRPSKMESFEATYAKRAGMLTGVDLLDGIAMLADIQPYKFAGVTDGPDNDYVAQVQGAIEILAQKNVVIIHVESPDAEGHDGNIAGKKAAVEAIDRDILGALIEYGKTQPLRILTLPDHPTPVAKKRHSRDLVPFVLSGPGVPSNSGQRLTEQEGNKTGLVVDPGYLLMSKLLT
jgi:2,3-bisphosphoglycerate-independent phosphoglycerate mutase